MSIEILNISHETMGSNLLVYPMLRQLRVAEIIDSHCPSEAEILVGTVVETTIPFYFC